MSKEKSEIITNYPVCSFPFHLSAEEKKNCVVYTKSPYHKPPFEHAIDIECTQRKEIYSPVTGKVIDLKQNSTQWFPYQKAPVTEPNEILNWVTIQLYQRHGFFSRTLKKTPWVVQLCHIEAFSSFKTVNEFVNAGELLARVGLNGIISTTKGKPDIHLHMVIGRGLNENEPFTNFQSYPIRFVDFNL